ncbi:hypothetical protein CBR_g32354 [Chara braunii]|uniref:MYB transcription factor n=1 Tax=Chara braunii TaxID=69332 RepID=A0A388JY67_CHABU|nr:hypothetical protein CBR_g32354 [Chara braunii]|eukprot:GBG62764.1 hypothetical protein CBR_g32354 [Chara braunii]
MARTRKRKAPGDCERFMMSQMYSLQRYLAGYWLAPGFDLSPEQFYQAALSIILPPAKRVARAPAPPEAGAPAKVALPPVTKDGKTLPQTAAALPASTTPVVLPEPPKRPNERGKEKKLVPVPVSAPPAPAKGPAVMPGGRANAAVTPGKGKGEAARTKPTGSAAASAGKGVVGSAAFLKAGANNEALVVTSGSLAKAGGKEVGEPAAGEGGNATPKAEMAWTPEDDTKLQQVVGEVGENWKKVAVRIHGRKRSECRARWMHLRSDLCVKRAPSKAWTEEEDAAIVRMYKEFGKKWTRMAKELPGRTRKTVKSRWLTALKHRVEDDGEGGATGDGSDGDMDMTPSDPHIKQQVKGGQTSLSQSAKHHQAQKHQQQHQQQEEQSSPNKEQRPGDKKRKKKKKAKGKPKDAVAEDGDVQKPHFSKIDETAAAKEDTRGLGHQTMDSMQAITLAPNRLSVESAGQKVSQDPIRQDVGPEQAVASLKEQQAEQKSLPARAFTKKQVLGNLGSVLQQQLILKKHLQQQQQQLLQKQKEGCGVGGKQPLTMEHSDSANVQKMNTAGEEAEQQVQTQAPSASIPEAANAARKSARTRKIWT